MSSLKQTSLENNRLLIEFDRQSGDICRMVDKENGKVLIDKVCRAVILDETACDTWAHDQKSLGEVVDTFSATDFEITESGPVRASVRITVKCRDSVIDTLGSFLLCNAGFLQTGPLGAYLKTGRIPLESAPGSF